MISLEVVAIGFGGICTVIGAMIAFILREINDSLSKLGVDVCSLNLKMAVIVERVDSHEKRLSELETNKGD